MTRPGDMRLTLRLRDARVELDPGRPLLMGVINASPESFFDGGRSGDLGAQLAQAHGLVEAGAVLVDVGGESGVTQRPELPVAREIARVVPLVERLAGDGVLVSVDTWKAEVAGAALAAGAVMVNDVSALREPAVAEACAGTGAGLVVTHTRVAPKEKVFPAYEDVRSDVVALLGERIGAARERGVGEEQIVVDPGPDLSKTPAETVEILRDLRALHELRRPILLAVSRKDFVGAITGKRPRGRLAGTLAAVGEGVDSGASIVRVHDVGEATDFLAVREALRGERPLPAELRLDERLRREDHMA